MGLYRSGVSQAAIGRQLGVTATRVRQILRRHGALPDKEIFHGTISAYVNDACRCSACRLVWREKNHEYRMRRKGKTPPQHGASAYTNWGCRCRTCRSAWAAACRLWYPNRCDFGSQIDDTYMHNRYPEPSPAALLEA